MAGRPTTMTPGAQENILRALRAGNTETAAVAFAQVGYETYRRFKTRNGDFRAAIEKAQADAQVQMVTRVVQAAAETWTAAAWWLERRHPADWGRVDRLELTLKQQAAEIAAALGLPTEEKTAAVREVERVLKEARKP